MGYEIRKAFSNLKVSKFWNTFLKMCKCQKLPQALKLICANIHVHILIIVDMQPPRSLGLVFVCVFLGITSLWCSVLIVECA